MGTDTTTRMISKKNKKKKASKLECQALNSSHFVDDLFSQLKKPPLKTSSDEVAASAKTTTTGSKENHAKNSKMARKFRLKENEQEKESWLDSQLNRKGIQASSNPNSSSSIVQGRTAEGWPIFLEDQLVSLTGGTTKDCPFDCECCY